MDHKLRTLYSLTDADAKNEWIQLQLKDTQTIERITVVYGSDCCVEYMPKIEIRVGDNEVNTDNHEKMLKENYLCDEYGNTEKKGEKMELEAKKTEENPIGKEEKVHTDNTGQKLKEQRHIEKSNKVQVVSCSTPLAGKYVTIQLNDKKVNKVDIAEIKIYAPTTGNYRIMYYIYSYKYYI